MWLDFQTILGHRVTADVDLVDYQKVIDSCSYNVLELGVGKSTHNNLKVKNIKSKIDCDTLYFS